MKSSIITVLFFMAGCLVGCTVDINVNVHDLSVYVLYILMIFIGMNIGGNMDLRSFAKNLNFRTLLVPLATITGTVLFAAIGGFILSQWSSFDCIAVGSGLCYYSLSSMLIEQLDEAPY